MDIPEISTGETWSKRIDDELSAADVVIAVIGEEPAGGPVRARSGTQSPVVVFDVVPHRIYEQLTFTQFRECTRGVDILISEVATVRRFLGLGSAAEAIDEQLARDTAARITTCYPRALLRYGPSGCDQEILVDANAGRLVRHSTGHDQATDKRGHGDRLAQVALRDFFRILPAPEPSGC
jgi:hypothetical protein